MATTTVSVVGKPTVTGVGTNLFFAQNKVDFSVSGTQTTSTDVIQALPVPKGAFVFRVGYYVSTVTTGSGDIDGVGDGTSTSGWIATDGDLASANLNRNSLPGDVFPALGGKLYTSADTIDLLMKTGVNTDGVVVVFALYGMVESLAVA